MMVEQAVKAGEVNLRFGTIEERYVEMDMKVQRTFKTPDIA